MAYIKKEQQNTTEDDGERQPRFNELLANELHATGEQHQAQSKQEKAAHIEAAPWRGEVRHIFAGIDQPCHANRNINQENPVPACPGNQHTPEDRAKYWADQPWHGDKVEYGEQFAAWVGTQQSEARHRHHHRAAYSLQYAKDNQLR